MRAIPTLMSVLALGLVTAACATTDREPLAVVEAFYLAANAGQYEEAKRLSLPAPLIIERVPVISSSEVDLIIRDPFAGDFQGTIDRYTRDRTLTKVEIQQVRVNGDIATCRVRKEFKDGSSQPAIVELFRDRADQRWKISWSSSML
jgi:hypothetical protein